MKCDSGGRSKQKTIHPKSLAGCWRIVWMSEWDQDYVDLEVPGYITLAATGLGNFQFGLVTGEIDWKFQGQQIHFAWTGSCEGDDMSGCGQAEIVGNELQGHLYIHLGDDFAFRAVRQSPQTQDKQPR